jgi:hypothetical protein
LLQLCCFFATIVHNCCYEVSGENLGNASGEVFDDISGEVSSEVGFATILDIFCYNNIVCLIHDLRRDMCLSWVNHFLLRLVWFCYTGTFMEVKVEFW